MDQKNEQFQPEKGRKRLGRRKFLLLWTGASVGAVGVMSLHRRVSHLVLNAKPKEQAPLSAPPDSSRVTVIRNEKIFSKEGGLVSSEVERALAAGMGNLFDGKDSAAAWRHLFKPDDVVGIKVNCIAGPELSTHPQLVSAIAAQLQAAGVPAENIIIWDRTSRELKRAGYTINNGPSGVKCYGTDTVGYEEKTVSQKSFTGSLSKILTRQITALINVPILKDHGAAGVTISMKNHYGSISNPGSQHKNQCDPYIADLNSVDEIRSKTRLIICDATRAACNGGPGYKPAFAWRYSGLLFSRDTVAIDTVGTGIINERRKETGLPSLEEINRYPRQLASAAERGLGNADSSRIDLRKISL